MKYQKVEAPDGVRDRLRSFAKETGRTLTYLAEQAEVNYVQLSQYCDSSLPGGAVLRKLEENAGLSASWWLCGNGRMYAYSPAGELLLSRKWSAYLFTTDPNSEQAETMRDSGHLVAPDTREGLLHVLREIGAFGPCNELMDWLQEAGDRSRGVADADLIVEYGSSDDATPAKASFVRYTYPPIVEIRKREKELRRIWEASDEKKEIDRRVKAALGTPPRKGSKRPPKQSK